MRTLAVTLISVALVVMSFSAMTIAQPTVADLAETTQILLDCTPDEGCTAKLSFADPQRLIAWKLDWGDGTVGFKPGNEPMTHVYKQAGDYVLVATVVVPNRVPFQVQKPFSIQPLGSPGDRLLNQAQRFIAEWGSIFLAVTGFLIASGLVVVKGG